MTEEEMIVQINDLIRDRKSFITDDKEASEIFIKDVKALEKMLDIYKNMQKAIMFMNSTLILLPTEYADEVANFKRQIKNILQGSVK